MPRAGEVSRENFKDQMYGGCSKGRGKGGTIGNTLPEKGILTNQGTDIKAI